MAWLLNWLESPVWAILGVAMLGLVVGAALALIWQDVRHWPG